MPTPPDTQKSRIGLNPGGAEYMIDSQVVCVSSGPGLHFITFGSGGGLSVSIFPYQ